MTVAELMEHLSKLPPEALIYLPWEDGGYVPMEMPPQIAKIGATDDDAVVVDFHN